jgi:selenide,water dikinase
VGPGDLTEILKGIARKKAPNLLAGANTLDDAAVYRTGPGRAVVATVDFFTPVVDDPRGYGRIAAANSLSDVYAMGGKPFLALNVLCCSSEILPASEIREILKGGEEKAGEAGVIIAGGHSVEDRELKYGLSVLGTVDPRKVIFNSGARPGDALILTKPLGIGLMTTGIKTGDLGKRAARKVARVMEELNAVPSELMVKAGASACTDVTGFGFLGHLQELAAASGVDIEVEAGKVPVMPEACEMLEANAVPGGLWTNRHHFSKWIKARGIDSRTLNVFFDPQTSGGLIISLRAGRADKLVNDLRRAGVAGVSVIGKVLAKGRGVIIVK